MADLATQLAQDLARYSPTERKAILAALEEKRKRDYFIKYWTPQPQQIAHFQKLQQIEKIFAVLGGNRSGKTEEGAAIIIGAALGKDYFRGEPAWEWAQYLPFPDPPLNIWVVGLDLNVLWDVIWGEKFLRGRAHPGFVPLDALLKPPSQAEPVLYFKNGTVITGKSAESGREKFQSASVDIVWIDEEPDVEIYDECYQRTSDCAGKILLTLTPLKDISSGVSVPWVHDLYKEFLSGMKDVSFVKLNVLENPHIPEPEKDKLKTKWAGHVEEGARLYGDFIQRSGLVYNMWNAAKHLIKPFPIPREWPAIVSIDPANTGYTAAVWGRVHPSGDIYLTKEYKERDLVISEHAKNIQIRNAGDPVDIWLIDKQWGAQKEGQTHKSGAQLYRDSGLPVRLAEVGEDYGMSASLEYVQATVTPGSRHPKIYVFDDLHKFRDEIEHYVWAFFGKGEMKGLSKEKPVKRNDHLMNAFQYLCAMRPRGKAMRVQQSPEDLQIAARLNSYT